MSKLNPKQSYFTLTHYEFNEIQAKMHYYKLQFNWLLWLYMNDKSTFEKNKRHQNPNLSTRLKDLN